jgi:hypothetical protein
LDHDGDMGKLVSVQTFYIARKIKLGRDRDLYQAKQQYESRGSQCLNNTKLFRRL